MRSKTNIYLALLVCYILHQALHVLKLVLKIGEAGVLICFTYKETEAHRVSLKLAYLVNDSRGQTLQPLCYVILC